MENRRIYSFEEFSNIMEHKENSGEVEKAFNSRLECPNCGETFIPIMAILTISDGVHDIICPICNRPCMRFQDVSRLSNAAEESKELCEKGEALKEQRCFEEAIVCFEKSLKANPYNLLAYFFNAQCLINLNRSQEALACIDCAFEHTDDSQDLAFFIALLWHQKAQVMLQVKRLEEAVECFEKGIQHNPTDAMLWFKKANVLEKLHRPGEAVSCYQHGLTIDPDSVGALNNLGLDLCVIGRSADALPYFDQALRLDPNDPEIWSNKALCLKKLGRHREAARCRAMAASKNFTAWLPFHRK